MDVKKTPHADLENKKTLFFSISLVITMSLVVMAFQWKEYDSIKVEQKSLISDNTENEIEVPVTDIPPPPVKTIQQPQIVEVPDEKQIEEDINIKFDAEITEDLKVQETQTFEAPKAEEEKEEVDQVFLVVEQPASPKDGMSAFYQYVSSKLVYPPQARRMEISGKVFVEFVVNKDGSITDVNVVKGIGGGCDEEAARIIASAPPWNPAKQRGRPVKQRLVLPIIFTMRGLS